MSNNWEFNASISDNKWESELKLLKKWGTRLRNLLTFPIKKRTKPLRSRSNSKNKKAILRDSNLKKKEREFRMLSWEKKLKKIEDKTEPYEFKMMELTKNALKLKATSEDYFVRNLVSMKVYVELRMKTTSWMLAFLNWAQLFLSTKMPSQKRRKTVNNWSFWLLARNLRRRKYRMKLKKKSSSFLLRSKNGDFSVNSGKSKNKKELDSMLILMKQALKSTLSSRKIMKLQMSTRSLMLTSRFARNIRKMSSK